MVGLIIFLIIAFIAFCVSVSKYNKMVRYKNKVKESLRLIDIQLQSRFDIIPNLVKTVKAYSKHENEVFSKLIEARKNAMHAQDEKEKLGYANEMIPEMRQVFAIAENYPELKADSLYKSLMEELVLIEDKIAASRRFYDSNVNEYNTLIGVFPNNMFASMFGFHEMELFKIEVGENFSSKISVD